LAPWAGRESVYFKQTLQILSRRRRFGLDTPWRELPKATRELVLHGAGEDGGFEGMVGVLQRRYKETTSEETRLEIERFMSERPCRACRGGRLRPESLAVRVGGRSIQELSAFTIKEASAFFETLVLGEREQAIARRVLKEIRERLGFLRDVGLEYLTLDRAAGTLSGGEGQRIRLATQIGSSLVGVLYILDEPSIALPPPPNPGGPSTRSRAPATGATRSGWSSAPRRRPAPPIPPPPSARGRGSWAAMSSPPGRRPRSRPIRSR